VGRRVPGVEEDDAVSAVSELEVREWMEEQGAGAEEPGARGGGITFVPAHARLHGVRRYGVGAGFSFLFSFVIPLVRITQTRDRPGRRAKGVLATSRHCADSGQETDCIYIFSP